MIQRHHRIRPSYQNIDVANRLFSPPQTPRRANRFHPWQTREQLLQFFRRRGSEVDQKTPRAPPVYRDRLQDLLFQLRPHPWQFAQLLFAAQALQIVDRTHAKSLDQHRDTLRPQPLDLQHLQRRRRILFEHLVAAVETAAPGDLPQNVRDPLTDPGDLCHLALRVRDNPHHRFRIALNRLRRIPVATDPEPVLRRNLHQIGGLIQ